MMMMMIAAHRAVYSPISHRGDSALMATPTSTDARMTSPRRSPATRSSCHSNIAPRDARRRCPRRASSRGASRAAPSRATRRARGVAE